MAERRPRYHLIDLVLAVIFCGLVAGAVRGCAEPDPMPAKLGAGAPGGVTSALICGGFVAWFFAWNAIRERRKAPACVDCGRRFVPLEKPGGPPVCPRCRRRSLTPRQAHREDARGLGACAIVLVFAAFLAGVMYYDPGGVPFGPGDWVTLPLLAFGTVAGLAVALFAAFIAFLLIRARWMRGERAARARAERVAGESGEEATLGPVAVWYAGQVDPTPMLAEAAAAAVDGVGAMLGRPIADRPPLRFFVFPRRDALVAFHREELTDLWNLDGTYRAGPGRMASMTTEVIPHRLGDPPRTARMLFAHHALESALGRLPPFWLNHGLVSAITAAGTDPAGRLNRRMLAALDGGTALGAELFRLGPMVLDRLMRGWADHAKFARFAQIQAQSWSIVEFLAGPEAPDELREGLRALANSLRPGEDPAPAFGRCLGRGPDELLDLWRARVRGRGLGAHRPPPATVAEALTTRLVPIVGDRGAKVMDRIQAVRAMGLAGYALGVDALVARLDPARNDALPIEEVVWSLEAISGRRLGDRPEPWLAWWGDVSSALSPRSEAGS